MVKGLRIQIRSIWVFG